MKLISVNCMKNVEKPVKGILNIGHFRNIGTHRRMNIYAFKLYKT